MQLFLEAVMSSKDDKQCSSSFETDWNHTKVIGKSSDVTRH